MPARTRSQGPPGSPVTPQRLPPGLVQQVENFILNAGREVAIDAVSTVAGVVIAGTGAAAVGNPELVPAFGIAGTVATRQVLENWIPEAHLDGGEALPTLFGDHVVHEAHALHFSGNVPPGGHNTFVPSMAPRVSRKRRTTTRRRAPKRVPRTFAAQRLTEFKHYDVVLPLMPTTGAWTTHAASPLPVQGTDFINRIGRRINIVKLQVNFMLSIASVADLAVNGNDLWCDIWMDRQTRGGLAAPGDIYQLPADNINSFQNASQLRRFKLLARSHHVVDVLQRATPGGVPEVAKANEHSGVTIPLRAMMEFTASGTPTLADVLQNGFICSHTLRTPNLTSGALLYSVRIRFTYTDY